MARFGAAFPAARLTYLVEAPAEPVVRHHPALDDIIVVERPRGLARVALRSARSRGACAPSGFDLVIDFHGGPRSGFLTWASGAPQRIGYDLPGRALVLHDARAVDAIAGAAAALGGRINGICSRRSASSRRIARAMR